MSLLITAALAGCGGGGGGDDASGSGGSGAAASLQDIATKAGCSSITADSEELYVREGGTCTAGDDELSVYTFNDAAAQQSWLEVAKGFGGVYVVGDRWVVSAPDADAAQRVQQKAGGEVQ